MKAEIYAEIFLWNREIDRLVRVLQRMESTGIFSKQDMKAYGVRLEEIRAALNGDFSAKMTMQERDDQSRLMRQRTTWERTNTEPDRK